MAAPNTWLETKQREQVPQALARLAIIGLFIAMWFGLWALRLPMPAPFLAVLCIEAAFFLAYLRCLRYFRSVRAIEWTYYGMLAVEIVSHTTMVYFLGGITWLGAFAYVFGLIFTNAFLDPKRGFVYTCGAAAAFASLAMLDAAGTIPHYVYLDEGAERYGNTTVLITTVLGATGVFFSIYAWVNWVGRQLRVERDTALTAQQQLFDARAALQSVNAQLEMRVRDRTRELQDANVALASSDELLRATIESTADGILVIDAEGRVAHHNSRFAEMWRIPQGLIETRDDALMLAFVLDQLTDPEAFVAKVRELYQLDREDFDAVNFSDGRVFERYSRPLMREGAVAGRVWSFRDVTERERAADLLRRQARYDALTGSLNHAAIAERLHELANAPTTGSIAVIMVDVDGMKAINDSYGHQFGDSVLAQVATILARDGALVGRYGGDEFLIALPGFTRPAAEAYCQSVLKDLDLATVTDPITQSIVPVIASLGLAVFPHEAATIEDAIRLADVAMYTEKRERRIREPESPVRGVIADERAARMIGEIVPLLTAPGDLNDKLRLVAHRISAAAGYEVVRFSINNAGAAPALSTFAKLAPEYVEGFEALHHRLGPGRLFDVVNRTHRPLIVPDIEAETRMNEEQRRFVLNAGIRTFGIVPMLWQDELIGIVAVASSRAGAIDARDVQFLATIADQVTAIIRMETLVGDLRSATEHLQEARADTVVLLAAAAEAHEHATGAHLHRVRDISEAIARELGRSDHEIEAIGLAAVLHDIGKIRVPEGILLSPARLNGEDWEIMKQHTVWGSEFLAERPGFELAAAVAGAHHERWDGAGYPRGLAGAEIPEVAAIVTVADSFDAITSDRPYRNGRPALWAIEEIERCSGSQFSPRVVDALLRLHARGDLVDTNHRHELDAAA